MKKSVKTILLLVLLSSLAFGLGGCGEEGTAEKTGKEIDKTMDSAKKKLNELTK